MQVWVMVVCACMRVMCVCACVLTCATARCGGGAGHWFVKCVVLWCARADGGQKLWRNPRKCTAPLALPSRFVYKKVTPLCRTGSQWQQRSIVSSRSTTPAASSSSSQAVQAQQRAQVLDDDKDAHRLLGGVVLVFFCVVVCEGGAQAKGETMRAHVREREHAPEFQHTRTQTRTQNTHTHTYTKHPTCGPSRA